MSITSVLPSAVVTLLTGIPTAPKNGSVYLGESIFVSVAVANLMPKTHYQIEIERIAYGHWTEWVPVDFYHHMQFFSGTDATQTHVLAHPYWGAIDGAPTNYDIRAKVFSLTNPLIMAYSNTVQSVWVETPRPD